MGLGDRINLIRKEKNMSIDDLCERSSIPKGTLSKITAGITSNPTLETVRAIAKALECKLDDLDDHPDYYDGFVPIERTIINKYRTLDQYGQDTVSAVLECEARRCAAELEKQQEQAHSPIEPRIVKVLYLPHPIQRASAGYGDPADDESAERICVLHNPLTQMADYIMTAHGDSMEPDIYSGDMLLVRRQPAVEVGETGIFIHRGERYVKIFRGESLHSANPDYPDIPTNEDTRCIGRVVGTLDPDWIVMNE